MEAIKLKRIYTREDYNILKQDKKEYFKRIREKRKYRRDKYILLTEYNLLKQDKKEYFKRIREKRKYKRTLRKKGITREARALNKYNSFTDIHKMIAFEKYKIYIYWDYYKEHAQDYITYIKYKTLKDQMRETENSIYKNLEKGTDKTTINNLIKEYNKLQYEYKKIFQDYKTIDIKRKIHREIKKYLEYFEKEGIKSEAEYFKRIYKEYNKIYPQIA
jgi:hypothetical protein